MTVEAMHLGWQEPMWRKWWRQRLLWSGESGGDVPFSQDFRGWYDFTTHIEMLHPCHQTRKVRRENVKNLPLANQPYEMLRDPRSGRDGTHQWCQGTTFAISLSFKTEWFDLEKTELVQPMLRRKCRNISSKAVKSSVFNLSNGEVVLRVPTNGWRLTLGVVGRRLEYWQLWRRPQRGGSYRNLENFTQENTLFCVGWWQSNGEKTVDGFLQKLRVSVLYFFVLFFFFFFFLLLLLLLVVVVVVVVFLVVLSCCSCWCPDIPAAEATLKVSKSFSCALRVVAGRCRPQEHELRKGFQHPNSEISRRFFNDLCHLQFML